MSRDPGFPAGRVAPVVLIALVVAAGAIVWLVTWSGGAVADSAPLRWGEAMRLRSAGRTAEARAVVADMRRQWAREDPQRNARLDTVSHDLDRIDQLVAEGRERIRSEAPSRTRVEQFEELSELRRQSPDAPEGIAARLLLSELVDLRMGAPQVVPNAPLPALAGSRSADPSGPEASAPIAAEPTTPRESALEAQLAAIASKRDACAWNEAVELLRLAREMSGPDDVARIEEASAGLRRAMRDDLDGALRRVREACAAGTVADVDAGLAMVYQELGRFPTGFAFETLDAERRDLERWRDRLAEAPPVAPVASSAEAPRAALAEVRALERGGDFAAAAARLAELVAAASDAEPALATQLDARRVELELLADFVAAVTARLADGKPVEFRLREKGPVAVTVAANGGLVAESQGTPVALDWAAIEPASIEAFCSTNKLSARALAGAGALAYRGGDAARAEVLLGKAVERDASLQPSLDPVIARGRGESADAGGYRYQDGRFLTARELRLAERATDLARDVRRLLDRPVAARDAALEEIAARGLDEVEALIVALHDETRRAVELLDKDSFRKQWDALAAGRRALDDARAQAIALIFDQVRYFYPYKPPAVTAERAREYAAVQREVDARVARVLEIWDSGDKPRPIPKRVRDRLGDIEWLLATLSGFGESLRGVDSAVDWARALPPDGQGLDVKTFCWDPRERAERSGWERISRFNQKKLVGLSSSEVAIVRITNSYRQMLGRAPLILSLKLCQSARGHAEEMASLGYFAHFSPTAGRQTPFDRMRLAGYEQGVSENIANHPGAESAHLGWVHSSGHHRNLLSASHTEFGVGNTGRLWVQNFGAGQDYRTDPDWSAD